MDSTNMNYKRIKRQNICIDLLYFIKRNKEKKESWKRQNLKDVCVKRKGVYISREGNSSRE